MLSDKALEKIEAEKTKPNRKLKIWEGDELQTVKLVYGIKSYSVPNPNRMDPVERNDRMSSKHRNTKVQYK